MQILQPWRPALNILVPANRFDGQLHLTAQPDGEMLVDVDLQNQVANSLLRYLSGGMIGQASTLIEGSQAELISEDLLYDKMADPFAACVGAYMLLRLGNLERLHTWTRNLMRFFEWLPDGAALWAEHLARQGDHHGAMEALKEMFQRGLPYFTDGLSYAATRLSTYARVEDDPAFAGAKEMSERLNPFVTNANFRQPTLVYTGLNPSKPDDKPLEALPDDQNIVDIASFF